MTRHVEVHIIKDIVSCFDCPHFEEVQDMNATIPYCRRLKTYLNIERRANIKPPIPSNCPLPEVEK